MTRILSLDHDATGWAELGERDRCSGRCYDDPALEEPDAFAAFAERWRPWRSWAAFALRAS